MFKNEIQKYKSLNEFAEKNGTVILGGSEDTDIPICELKQAFASDDNFYNRSVTGLSVNNAQEIYDECISAICPDTIMLHIGKADLNLFESNPAEFENLYRELIRHIKADNKFCTVAVVSFKNHDNAVSIAKLNKDLKYIAESEQCEYYDISQKRVINPKQLKDTVSFVYSLGFIHPLRNKHPRYDLVNMLFCFEA